MYQLKYGHIPTEWIQGLPIGNGRLAAMYWGDTQKDILSLNHEGLWRKKHVGKVAPNYSDQLPMLRKLLKEKDYFRATVFANLFFGGLGGCSGVSEGQYDPYQPAGNLVFTYANETKSNESLLNIETALLSVTRDQIACDFFVDANDGNIMARWKSGDPFSGTLHYTRETDPEAEYTVQYAPDAIDFSCTFVCGHSYRVKTTLKTDGAVQATDDGITISGATELVCATNIFIGEEDERTVCLDFDALLKKHEVRFASYMDRVQFRLDAEESPLYTDERLQKVRNGEQDNGLLELYFHYGRYLMIASCICGKYPPNLQGKWDLDLKPDWRSDYHFDINLQMNEWMIESVNFSEFAEPLTNYLLKYLDSGRVAAKNVYGCRGILLPLAGDIWCESRPESFGYAVYVSAAAWMAQSLWQHYLYTGDLDYLRDKAYVFFKEIALFYEDFLEADENGILQIMPSQSPENRYVGAGIVTDVGICTSSAHEVQLAYDALGYAFKSARILNIDLDSADKWEQMQQKLPPFAIGSDGRLMEWNEEFEEEQPGHKHLSHLYGLHPSDIFTPESRPKEYAAAVKSFRFRLAHQSGYTGWSRAWIANMLARIGDAENFYIHTHDLLQTFATDSLLDIHPHPLDTSVKIFQIDGNFGMVSAVTEALCSFFDGKVHLLHALPACWPNGHISGIKLPGGHTLSFAWKDGKLQEGKITLGYAEKAVVTYCGKEQTFTGAKGSSYSLI